MMDRELLVFIIHSAILFACAYMIDSPLSITSLFLMSLIIVVTIVGILYSTDNKKVVDFIDRLI